jgi:hypothetical protein
MFTRERKTILAFLTKYRLKFDSQLSMFLTEKTKVLYAGSRLEGPLFAWFTPLNARLSRPNKPTLLELTSFEDFATALTTLYRDPHLALTAERELRALRQTRSVAQYIAQFEEHR